MKNGRKSREQGAGSRERGARSRGLEDVWGSGVRRRNFIPQSGTSTKLRAGVAGRMGKPKLQAVAMPSLAALADADKSGRTRRSALPWIRSRRKWLIINERNFEDFLPWTVNVHGSLT